VRISHLTASNVSKFQDFRVSTPLETLKLRDLVALLTSSSLRVVAALANRSAAVPAALVGASRPHRLG
jgi:hypothetical protein